MLSSEVTIIGVGGIGSWTAEQVMRLGCPCLVCYDDDEVLIHNMENQNYVFGDVSRPRRRVPKVQALLRRLLQIKAWHTQVGRTVDIVMRNKRATADDVFRGIVVVCVDTIEGRRDIFSACCGSPAIPLYIEAGAAENLGTVRVLVPSELEHVHVYEELLRTYQSGGPAPCVSPYMGGLFASVISSFVVRFEEGWRPLHLTETRIDFRNGPVVTTEEIRL